MSGTDQTSVTDALDAVQAKVGPLVNRAQAKARREVVRLAGLDFWHLPAREAIRLAYNALLHREPDQPAWDNQTAAVVSGIRSIDDIVDAIRCSSEFRVENKVGAPSIHGSLHSSRCEFIISLPPARTIVDLGGGHTVDGRGALVMLGYPYEFDELIVVDLPPDERHPLYHSAEFGDKDTGRGKVRYEYHSMADLSFAEDASVDLVYSGQSIEHVTESDGEKVLSEAFRVLRPGGYLAIDTPNGKLCRLQQDGFIDPDHKVEYTLGELRAKVKAAGFHVVQERGLNWGGQAAIEGRFDPAEIAGNRGIYFDAEHSYLLALILQKPATRARKAPAAKS